eukprot:jgi/Hompol1/4072/HPOL_000903-RA
MFNLQISLKMFALAVNGEFDEIAEMLINAFESEPQTEAALGSSVDSLVNFCKSPPSESSAAPVQIQGHLSLDINTDKTNASANRTVSSVNGDIVQGSLLAARARDVFLGNLPRDSGLRRSELVFRYCSTPNSTLFIVLFPQFHESEMDQWLDAVRLHRTDAVQYLLKSGSTQPRFAIGEECVWAAFQNGFVELFPLLQSAGGNFSWMESLSAHGSSEMLISVVGPNGDHGTTPGAAVNTTATKRLDASAVAIFNAYGGQAEASSTTSGDRDRDRDRARASSDASGDGGDLRSPVASNIPDGDSPHNRSATFLRSLEKLSKTYTLTPAKSGRQQRSRKNQHATTAVEEGLGDMTITDADSDAAHGDFVVSLNHLINFSFPPRQQHTSSSSVSRRRNKNAVYEPYNKQRFVNANFRFILKEGKQYTPYLTDPDIVVEWEDIDQVHYLHLGEQAWRKCPICYDSIYNRDLKSVRVELGAAIGRPMVSSPATVAFTLMKRRVGSTIALPVAVSELWSIEASPPSISLASASRFSKLLVSSKAYRDTVAQNDIRQLQLAIRDQLAQAAVYKHVPGWDSEKPFMEMCLVDIKASLEAQAPSTLQAQTNQQPYASRPISLAVSTSEGTTLSRSPDSATSPIASTSPAFYFYQAQDGQLVFLHPLDIKILKSAYGDYEKFPETIQATVLSAQESTMNMDLRKRCKYLDHLPLSCDVTFCETDLTSIVSADVLAQFSREMDARMNRLRKIENDEIKARLKDESKRIHQRQEDL